MPHYNVEDLDNNDDNRDEDANPYEENEDDFDDDDYGDPDDYDPYMEDEDRDYLIDGVGFADPGGRSALRAATKHNPRNRPCPTCGRKNMLTPLDVSHGYQCDSCADKAEGHMRYGEY